MAGLALNLNLLATLDVLLREDSVNRTAARFGVSQAAVSAQLAKLRAHFGDELFVPRGRRLVKTPFAETLVGPVRDLIDRSRQVISLRQSFDPLTSDRSFRLHAGDIDSILLLAPLVRCLQSAAPGMRVHSHGAAANPANVDFFIRPIGMHNPEAPYDTLYTDHYCVLADQAHPEQAAAWDIERYLALEHVVRHVGHSGALSFEAATMARLGHARKTGMIVEYYGSVAPLLVGTRYVSTVPSRFAAEMARLYPLKILPLPFAFPEQSIVLQWSEHLANDSAALWMRNFIQQIAHTLYATGHCSTPHEY
ncbi:LysR family transcriptional regulator [Pseudomonas sp. NPDC007930]|uniref:LysR family transcriptional regulator n=1 Tax=Pseudomonas sp. NPDC007930 TaxID=3364417 RepID=UPI0036EED1A4